jgi:hypothetical protein
MLAYQIDCIEFDNKSVVSSQQDTPKLVYDELIDMKRIGDGLEKYVSKIENSLTQQDKKRDVIASAFSSAALVFGVKMSNISKSDCGELLETHNFGLDLKKCCKYSGDACSASSSINDLASNSSRVQMMIERFNERNKKETATKATGCFAIYQRDGYLKWVKDQQSMKWVPLLEYQLEKKPSHKSNEGHSNFKYLPKELAKQETTDLLKEPSARLLYSKLDQEEIERELSKLSLTSELSSTASNKSIKSFCVNENDVEEEQERLIKSPIELLVIQKQEID